MCSPATSFQGRLFRKFSPIPTRQSIEKLRSFSQHSSSFSNTQEKLEPCFDGHFQNILNKLSKHNVYKTVPSIADVSLDSNVRLTLFSGVLRSCASKGCLNKGKAVQGQVIKNGMDPDLDFWDLLASLYVKCGSLQCARQVLDEMPERDVVSWTVLIKGLVDEGYSRDGVTLYGEMRKDGIRPDGETLVSALKACLGCLELEFGLQLHAEVIKMGLFSNFLVGSAFVEIYSKCGLMELASMTFFYISKKSVVSWNALIDGYALMGDWEEILNLFCEIRELELKHGKFTLLTVLKSCAHLGNLRGGKAVHAQAIKIGSELDKFLSCCLLNMYSKCEFPEYALKVFQRIRGPKIAAWSAMIHCLHQGGQSQEAAEMFCLMRHSGVLPNEFTLASLISVATSLGYWKYSESIHACAYKYGFQSDNFISNALVTMYMKTGFVNNGWKVFSAMSIRDTASLNALLSGFLDNRACHLGPKIFREMLVIGLEPDIFTFTSILKSCSNILDVGFGRQVHARIIKDDLRSNGHVGTALLDMYAKCRCLEDADVILNELTERDLLTWTAIISNFAQSNQGQKAVKCFIQMQQEGKKMERVFSSVPLSNRIFSWEGTPSMQTSFTTVERGIVSDAFSVAVDAVLVVYSMLLRIKSCFRIRTEALGLKLMECELLSLRMRSPPLGFRFQFPNKLRTTSSRSLIVPIRSKSFSCAALSVVESSPTNDLDLSDTRNSPIQVHEGFKRIPRKEMSRNWPNSVSMNEKIDENVRSRPVSLDRKERLRRYSGMLRDCASKRRLNEGMAIHGQVIKSGIDPDSHLWVSLVNAYAKCGCSVRARRVLDEMPERDVVSWTALIQGFVAEGCGSDGVSLFCEMKREGVRPNEFTLATGLKACAMCMNLSFGKQVHAEAIKVGCFLDLFVGSVLVDLYAKCGEMELADRVFCCMPEQNDVSWTALLNGYAQVGGGKEVLRLFGRMRESEMKFSKFTLSTVLKGCATSGNLREGQAVHSVAIKIGCEIDEFLGCSLVDMYSKCGLAYDALKVFKTIKDPDVVAWSAIITCLDQQGHSQEAAQLFHTMRYAGVPPNEFSFSSLVSVAADLGDLQYGESIHACICKYGFENDMLVNNALITMYMKNGFPQAGIRVFEAMGDHDLVSWNALLSGCHGYEICNLGPRIFYQMLLEGFTPNMYSYISVLRSCSSLLDLRFGKQVHAHVIKYTLDGNDFVGTALIDMYAKSRCLEDADVVFNRLIKRDLFTWTVIITGYTQTDQSERAVKCFSLMQQEGVKPNEFTLASCLSGCSRITALETGQQLHSMAIKGGHGDIFVSSALVDINHVPRVTIQGKKLTSKVQNPNGASMLSEDEYWNATVVAPPWCKFPVQVPPVIQRFECLKNAAAAAVLDSFGAIFVLRTKKCRCVWQIFVQIKAS
nr:pentatricopeptide repeat-containing protein, mitochondrial [Quercus suber]